MKHKTILFITIVINILQLHGQQEKISHTLLIKDLSTAQILIDTEKYDESLALLFDIRKRIENAGYSKDDRGFYYTRVLHLETKIHKNRDDLASMLKFVNNVFKNYTKVYKSDERLIGIISVLISSLKKFRPHKNYKSTVDSYNFFKNKLPKTEMFEYYTQIIDYEIDFINNDKKKVPVSIPEGKIGSIEDYQDSYSEDDELSSWLDKKMGEWIGNFAKYEDTLLGILGLKPGFETKGLKTSDFNINSDLIITLLNNHYFKKNPDNPFTEAEKEKVFEIIKRFDTILPNKFKKDYNKNIKQLKQAGKENSVSYFLEEASYLLLGLIRGEKIDDLNEKMTLLKKFIDETNILGDVDSDELENFTKSLLYMGHFQSGDYNKTLEIVSKNINNESTEEKLQRFILTTSIYMEMRDFINAELCSKKIIDFKMPKESGIYDDTEDAEDLKEFIKDSRISAYLYYIPALVINNKYREALKAIGKFERLLSAQVDSYDYEENKSLLISSKAMALVKTGQYKKADNYMVKYLEFLDDYDIASNPNDHLLNLNDFNSNSSFSLAHGINENINFVLCYLSARLNKSDRLTEMALNSILFYKELITNIDKKLSENVILDSDNEALKDLFYKSLESQELASDINTKNRDSVLDYAMFYKRNS
jgi:hypothetical protein